VSPPKPAQSQPAGSATRAIALLAVATFASQSMVRVTDSLLPQIAADFSVSVGAASVIVTGYALAHGSVQLVIGPVGDRFGKYTCVTAACLLSTVLVLLCALTASLPQLFAARLASGLAAGWVFPLGMAFLGDVIPYENRQKVLGRFLSGQALGQLFGQTAGGILGDWFGWRNVFFILAALFAAATAGLIVELIRNPITHRSHPTATQGGGFIAGYRAVLSSRWALTVIVAGCLENCIMFGAFAYVGADLHLRFGLRFTLVGLFVGAFAIGGLIYSLSVGMLVNRIGQLGMAIAGGVVLAVMYCALALEPLWWLLPLTTCGIGFGFYMLHNTLQTNATQMMPQARGTAVALFSSSLYLGQTAGVATAALAFDRHGGVPLFIAAGLLLLALALWFTWRLSRHQREN
jgi:YNFM family putative membrane transporter